MKAKLKVMTVVGTRPEIIRLARVICKLDMSSSIEHLFVHTGQNYDYELNQIFFEDLQIRKPNYFLNAAGATGAETIGNILINIDRLLEQEKPDAFLVLGDTNSCLCTIPAKKRKIPIFHMEAGNRCFDQRVPEETNRKIVDHVADINLTYSDIARSYLLSEGLPADRIIKTGSPMYEVLNHYLGKIKKSDILNRLGLEPYEYFVVSSHREENINDNKNFLSLITCLNKVSEEFSKPIIMSTHPRTAKMIANSKIKISEKVILSRPLGFFDYNFLQMNAYAVLSDSGTISEESSILNFRAINIREAHERPEAMEEAAVMLSGLSPERLLQCLYQLDDQPLGDQRNFRLVSDYCMPNVSDKVVRVILSYTDYVKRVVWRQF